ncbi:zinc dependent phospholipase C family protein [Paenibacillus filicis]|uniref:Zinc dependent phospholipase C family protein n=1 Tax=Paenibacillus filicis TaxID=669464 RepID=A0ABU9DL20_9BACL
MHLIIAKRITERLPIADKASFLLGGLAPDSVSPKDLSHFFVGDSGDYSRSIDYLAFLEQYRAHAKHPYVLGYLAHLIADHLWLHGFYQPWLKNRMQADPDVLPLYHRDFRLLNGKLLEVYGYAETCREMLNGPTTILDLQEVTARDVEAFLPSVFEDMEYDQEAIHEHLHVFTWPQIIGYIETSVEKGLWILKPMLT